MDNFYNSINLFQELESRQIGAAGTIRANRKDLPHSIKNPGRTKKGDLKCYFSGNLLCLLWKDKRDVRFLTNCIGGISEVTRWSKQGQENIERPNAISIYNLKKAGVDKEDQMESYYSDLHRSSKWWKRIFISLIEISSHNSFILYKLSTTQLDLKYRYFKEALITKIFSMFLEVSSANFVITMKPACSIERRESKNCCVCSTTANRKQTIFYCIGCNKNVCPEHFIILHKKRSLRKIYKTRNVA